MKRHLIDAVGCAIGAHTLPQGRMFEEHIAVQGGREESRILGTATRAPAAQAAWANAGLINTLDFDDVLHGHPGATIVGPALALAEATSASGRALIAAMAVGYETSLRVSEATRPSVARWRMVSSSATAQTFGSVAVAAHLLRLDAERTTAAYGLAGSVAPVPSIRKFGTADGGRIAWQKNNYGAAAAAGVTGALLANRGVRGHSAILDGATGFWVMAGSDAFDPTSLEVGIEGFERTLAVAIKPYPCCRFFHAAVDAVQEVLDRIDLDPEAVEEIRVHTVAHLQTFMNRRPETPFDAEFSAPHAIASAMLRTPPGLAWFDEARLGDVRLKHLMDSIRVVVDEQAEACFSRHEPYETRVEIVMKGGATHAATIGTPRGHPTRPMSQEDLEAKFLDLTTPTLGRACSEQVMSELNDLETFANVRSLHLIAA